jgi:hypothetical protein
MQLPRTPWLAVSAVLVVPHCLPVVAQNPSGTVGVRVELLKRSIFERQGSDGPRLIGPQSALELEWRLYNGTGGPLEIPSFDVLRLHVTVGITEIPVRTEWAATMTLRSGTTYDRVVSEPQPVGAITLPDNSSVWVRGSTKTLDGSPFGPHDYVVRLDIDLRQVLAFGARSTARVDAGFPVQLHIVALNSPERRRQFHMVEGAFYRDRDKARALELFKAAAALPGASPSRPAVRGTAEFASRRCSGASLC